MGENLMSAMDLEALISSFDQDPTQLSLRLPPNLGAHERKQAKSLAKRYHGLECESFGFGAERQLHLFKAQGCSRQSTLTIASGMTGFSDEGHSQAQQDFTFGRADSGRLLLEDFTFGKEDSLKSVVSC